MYSIYFSSNLSSLSCATPLDTIGKALETLVQGYFPHTLGSMPKGQASMRHKHHLRSLLSLADKSPYACEL